MSMRPQRLILSRKGFDTSSGGCPSPIFPDGAMFSLPIPEAPGAHAITYADVRYRSSVGAMVAELTNGRTAPNCSAHLDPDVREDSLQRQGGWRPLFGQKGAPQGHLRNQQVGAGDLFLFFGLYRRVENPNGRWRFVRGQSPLHILWGWFQIERTYDLTGIERDAVPPWARYHPHMQDSYLSEKNNTLYVASDTWDMGDGRSAAGAGGFPAVDDRLVLTAPGPSPSCWRLPRWFYSDGNRMPLSHHSDPRRWDYDDEYAYLRSVPIGQEFVLDLEHYPEALPWVSDLIRDFGQR